MKYVQVSKGRLHTEQRTLMSMAALSAYAQSGRKKENSNRPAILAHEENHVCRQSHTDSAYNTNNSLMSMSFPLTHGIFVFRKI